MKLENKETLNKLETVLTPTDLIDLILVLQSERPGCLVMEPEKEASNLLKKLCRENKLSFRVKNDEQDSGLATNGFFIARREKRFEVLKGSEGRFYGLSDRDVGKFLGYPEDDVEYFEERIVDRPVEHETREKMRELVSTGELENNEFNYVELVGYVPRPEKQNILEAVEKGKKYYKAILEFDADNNFSIGKRALEEFLGEVKI